MFSIMLVMANNNKKYYSNLWNSIDSEKAQHSLDSLQERLVVTSLSVPETFLTDKIPNDAKYELEQFFRYIKKKYGI